MTDEQRAHIARIRADLRAFDPRTTERREHPRLWFGLFGLIVGLFAFAFIIG